jgi:hypothetical protein
MDLKIIYSKTVITCRFCALFLFGLYQIRLDLIVIVIIIINPFSPRSLPHYSSAFFSGLIFNRMNQDMRYQYCEFEKLKADMEEIKKKLK